MKILTPSIIILPQPEEAVELRRYQFGCGNRCACSVDGGPSQVVVDGLLISCICDGEAAND